MRGSHSREPARRTTDLPGLSGALWCAAWPFSQALRRADKRPAPGSAGAHACGYKESCGDEAGWQGAPSSMTVAHPPQPRPGDVGLEVGVRADQRAPVKKWWGVCHPGRATWDAYVGAWAGAPPIVRQRRQAGVDAAQGVGHSEQGGGVLQHEHLRGGAREGTRALACLEMPRGVEGGGAPAEAACRSRHSCVDPRTLYIIGCRTGGKAAARHPPEDPDVCRTPGTTRGPRSPPGSNERRVGYYPWS